MHAAIRCIDWSSDVITMSWHFRKSTPGKTRLTQPVCHQMQELTRELESPCLLPQVNPGKTTICEMLNVNAFIQRFTCMYVIDISYSKGSHSVQEIDFLIKTESYIIYGF